MIVYAVLLIILKCPHYIVRLFTFISRRGGGRDREQQVGQVNKLG